jgi:ATP-dependent Clp protease, protease subunit
MKPKLQPAKLTIRNAHGNVPELLIYDDIGPDYYGLIGPNTVAQALKELGDVGEIRVRINSPGGSVFDGVAIYNQLKSHKAKMTVVIDGLAASIASIIAMAGDTVEIAENAMMMIHDPMAFAWGNAAELRKMTELLDSIKTTLVGTYAARTGEKSSAEQIEKWMTDETWFNGTEAVDSGLADLVSANKAASAYIDPIYAYKKTPDQFKTDASYRTAHAKRRLEIAARA